MSDLRQAEVLGADPLDGRVGGPPARPDSWWMRHHLASGLSATPIPGLLLVVGLAIGPEGLNLLSRDVLAYADPAVSAALTAVGLLVGLGLDLRGRRERRLLAGASAEATLTLLFVALALAVASVIEPSITDPTWAPVWLLAICISASSPSAAAGPAVLGSSAERLAELDDVLPILVGGAALAAVRATAPAGTVALTLQTAALAAAIGVAAWLLLARPSSESEQHVLTAGVVLLLGGLAEFLGTSALLNGLVAGVLLGAIGGPARERVARDVRHVQHPLTVLLLLVAGARVSFTPALSVLVVGAVVARTAGKLAGGRLLRPLAPGPLGRLLVSPGVMAAAFALNCSLVGADPAGLVLGAAVLTSVFSELLALIVRRQPTP